MSNLPRDADDDLPGRAGLFTIRRAPRLAGAEEGGAREEPREVGIGARRVCGAPEEEDPTGRFAELLFQLDGVGGRLRLRPQAVVDRF